MLKLQSALSTALASLLVLPAVSGQERALSLEQALSQTVRSLELLAGIESEVRTGSPEGMHRLRSITESSPGDSRQQDEQLAKLRDDLGRLQLELELLEATAPARSGAGASAANLSPAGPAHLDTNLTTGLSDAQRNAILTTLGGTPQNETPPPVDPALPDVAPSSETYSADPLLQGRACYRAGQYARGLALLEPLKMQAPAVYTKARCLEQLGRLDEALLAFKRVIELAPDGFEAGRAQSDIEFLEWKKGFVSNLKKDAKNSGGAPK